MKTTTLAIAAAMAAGMAVHAQDADCNVNGIPDATEIAQGLADDCNANGIPDVCDYSGESRTMGTLSTGWNDALVFYLTVPEPVSSDLRVDIGGVGDFGDADEYLSIYVGEVLVATVWVHDGLDCDPEQSTYQEATVYVPQDLFNITTAVGTVALRIVPSEAVYGTPDCGNGGWARVQYLRSLSDDCDGNGIPDSCDIVNDASLDCNGNGTIDACEIAANTGYFNYDCDDDGVHDACQIAADPAIDSNADWVLDAYQISLGDFTLDRVIDGADLAYVLESWGPSKGGAADLNQDGVVDAFELVRVLGNWGRYPTGWGVVLEAAPNPRVVTHDGFRAGIESTGLPWRVRDNKTGIELLLVPPGTFTMGCSPHIGNDCNPMEYPLHPVTLTRPFFIGRFEVRQSQWSSVIDVNPSQFLGSQHPVDRVSWNDVQAFGIATDFRLPTEAEWEFACRAGTSTAYNNGSNDPATLPSIAWVPSGFMPVGMKWANGLGLHDMHQNVWEHVQDRIGWYPSEPITDPTGPTSGSTRVYRGGGGFGGTSEYACRSSFRMSGQPTAAFPHLGFRVARTP